MKNFKLGDNPIAVVGMASLMPDAKDLSSYWDNIVERLVSIVDVPADRWSIDDYYDANPRVPDKTYCKRGAFIPDIDFNPVEYGLPPNILEVTDVSQLLGLVVAKDVLADSGILSEEDYNHDRIGITLGIGGGQKLSAALTARLQYPVIDKVLKNAGVPDAERLAVIEKYKKAFVPWEENSFPGLLGNVIAGRIANRFNFGGMNSVVDAACASSLSAMKMAVNELVLGHSDMMITGGSCTDNSIFMYMSFSKTPAFTPAEFIKPFDAESNGMMVGEGLGMIALKRLEDAERDGDRIYALIKGMGSSSDGRFKSIYAPRPEGQAKALKRAYDQAGFEPRTIGLVEAHGTGTAAGDVAEFNSLKTVFSENNEKKQYIALGSVKSQIGHLKAAAGAAGFIKCALALHHKVLPPTASVKTPNPKLGIENSPFYINAETRPWLPAEDGSPRRAAVSAFGFGGTNFHFVLEEYQKELIGATRLKHVDQVSLIAAANENALLEELKKLQAFLNENSSPLQYQAFIEKTKLKQIEKNQARLAFVSNEAAVAKQMLELAIKTLSDKKGESSWELLQGISYQQKGNDVKGNVVALFPGQGSQYLRMGDALAQDYPEFREGFAKLDTLFAKDGLGRLSDIVYPIASFTQEAKKAQEACLQLTQHAQPSIGAFSVGAYKLFKQAGFNADFVAGHSFGELSALWAAGVYSEDDFYFLAKSRGAAMAAPDDMDFDAGTMIAVSGDVPTLEKVLKNHPEIKIANFNSNAQVVIAGGKQALANAQDDLKAAGLKLIQLPVSAAFHTPLVAHAQKPFAKAIDTVKFSKPSIPVYANGTGKAHEASGDKIKKALKDHILNSVQFRDEIENIYKDGGRIFVEFGPKNVLAKLCDNILEGKDDVITLAVNPAPTKNADSQLKQLAARLSVVGLNLSDIDPYVAPRVEHATEKPSPLNIKISAAAYVSDKTRKAFEDGLNDGFTLQTEKEVRVEVPVAASSTSSSVQAVSSGSSVINAEINLDQFYALQSETLRVHEKYLENPAQYVESFQSLITQLTGLMRDNPDFELPASIEKSLHAFNEQQKETIKVHESFLNQQARASEASLQLMSQHYSLLTGGAPLSSSASVAKKPEKLVPAQASATAVVAAKPATVVEPKPVKESIQEVVSVVEQESGFDVAALTREMLDVVAEKTGYPSEMLELDMDMEADLGIDSIKRVEILGSIQEAHPELPELDPEALAELRTLKQIVDYISDQVPAGAVTTSSVSSSVSVTATTSSSFDVAALTREMLDVVAEKTGYPSEMLELDMDMEADLGIDSIKRVEILGSIQEAHPELPELDPEALAELRTLKQIVDYISDQVPAGAVTTSSVSSSVSITATTSSSFDVAALTKEMLDVVAEKTGYPSEMLELDMDMEADLGIDSIKRVEILGSIQEAHPELPELDPEALAELRTLRQIVDHIKEQMLVVAPRSSVARSVPQSSPTTSAAVANFDVASLTQEMLTVVAEKTGYPSEMLELDMDMEADLGIDSIKRVEILGSIQEAHPELPELDPEALAELRTLRQIVDHIKNQVSVTAAASSASVPSENKMANNSVQSIDVEALTSMMLSVVAEKTGYPVEMLELDMDMEADLGIDSIKRVEILGAVQEANPGLPELDPEALAELRTLAQIIDYMKASTSSVSAVAQSGAELVSLDEYKKSHEKHEAINESASLKPARAYVKLKALARPDTLVTKIPTNRCCVLVNDGTELSAHVASVYQNAGWKLAVLSFNNIEVHAALKKIKNVKHFSLKTFEENELKTTLDSIESELGKLANLVYLDSSYKASGKQGLAFDEKGVNQLRHLFLLAKHLKTSLNSFEKGSRNAFVAVTHLDGKLGYSSVEQKSKYDALTGGVFGLLKTLNQEWPEVYCRAIDLEPSLKGMTAAEFIFEENNDAATALVEVGISKEGRYTLEVDEVNERPEIGSEKDHQITNKSVFVVSGGAKGVTSKCVIELAKAHQASFILLGRSELNAEEPSWSKNCVDEAALKTAAMAELKIRGEKPTPVVVQKFINPVLSEREIKTVLSEIEKAGSRVRYVACDVCDAKKLSKALWSAQDDLGEITGLVHGAGVLADKLIENKTVEDFNAVFNTKISGLAALLSVIDVKKLKHLVLFSSAAGFFGNPAQSDYAIANDILNKVALIVQSQNKSCRALSFNWGPWDGGMVTPQLKKLFNARGVELISLEGGAQLFVDYLSAKEGGHAQVLVGSSMEASASEEFTQKKSLKSEQPIILKRVLNPVENPFLQAHKIGEQAVLPIVCSAAWHVSGVKSCYPAWHFSSLEHVQVYKGVIFNNDEAREFFQEISDAQIDDVHQSLELRSVIFSEDSSGKRVNHYGALVKLSAQKPVMQKDVSLRIANDDELGDAEGYYEDGTLFHGKLLQLLDDVIADDEKLMIFDADTAELSIKEQGQFVENEFNHFSMDALLQAALVWARRHRQLASLPLKIGELDYFSSLDDDEFFITLKLKSETASKMVCDLYCHDADGNIYAQMLSAEITMSKQLDKKFAS